MPRGFQRKLICTSPRTRQVPGKHSIVCSFARPGSKVLHRNPVVAECSHEVDLRAIEYLQWFLFYVGKVPAKLYGGSDGKNLDKCTLRPLNHSSTQIYSLLELSKT